MEGNLQGLRWVVESGDLTGAAVDAVVNAANNHLWMGAGVAGALKRSGGDEIEREAIAQGPIPVGEAVVTTAGALNCRHVIHAATIGVGPSTSSDLVRRATLNALRRASEHKLETIAFPALGTGVGGLSFEACARAMWEAVEQHVAEGTSVQVVRFVLFDDEAADAFKRVLSGSENEESG